MHPTVELFGLRLPTYGIVCILAILFLVTGGLIICKKNNLSVLDGMVLGAYGLLGAYAGAKLLYFMEWGFPAPVRSEYDLLLLIKNGGSAYGGILLGLLFSKAGAYIHKINYREYMGEAVFLLPLCHGIWKMGCHCAGCCYGIPYSGPGSIVYTEGSYAPVGTGLFPVQLLEAVILFVIALILYLKKDRSPEDYLGMYSFARFILEFFRNRETKRMIGCFSDIQLLCMCCIVIILVLIYKRRRKDEKSV